MSAAAFRGTNAWRWPAQVAFGTNVPIPSGEGKGVAAGKGGRRKGQQREKYLSAPTSRLDGSRKTLGGEEVRRLPKLAGSPIRMMNRWAYRMRLRGSTEVHLVRAMTRANVLLRGAVFRVGSKSALGGSASILLPNAPRESAVAPSPRSADPSSCQLFQYRRRVHRGYFLQDVRSVHPLPPPDQISGSTPQHEYTQ